jgi:hypothetical protein
MLQCSPRTSPEYVWDKEKGRACIKGACFAEIGQLLCSVSSTI